MSVITKVHARQVSTPLHLLRIVSGPIYSDVARLALRSTIVTLRNALS